ncbi:MAG: hypothetical protein IMF05_11870 [Proteobacteria bacterium]|nr:hypothetical protein [Pseudomonadota bacterium]
MDEPEADVAPAYAIRADLLRAIPPEAQAVTTIDGVLCAVAVGWNDARLDDTPTDVKRSTCRLQHLRFMFDALHDAAMISGVAGLEQSNTEVKELHAVAGGSAERDDITLPESEASGPAATGRT